MAEGQVRGCPGNRIGALINPGDSTYISELIQEYMLLGNPPFDFYKLDVERSQYDPRRKEVIRPVYADEPIGLPAWIEVNPSEKTLKSFGIEKKRELIVTTSKAFLDNNGLKFDYGDIIVVFGEEYYVWEADVPSGGRFGFRADLLMAATCMRKMKSSTKDSGPFDDQEQADEPQPKTDPVPEDWNV